MTLFTNKDILQPLTTILISIVQYYLKTEAFFVVTGKFVPELLNLIPVQSEELILDAISGKQTKNNF